LAVHLPTEAQWEYACRAGTITPFHFGSTITTDQANFDGDYPYNKGPKGEYRKKTVSVKTFSCNAWGLYEMHGNVWEWCQDWYGAYPKNTIVDPTGPNEGESRVLRGGSWFDYGRDVRSAHRHGYGPAVRLDFCGLRLARGQTASQGSGGAGQSRPKVPG
jgi:formylglycine-generating enzyme required for sulfatase activity